MAAPGHHRQIDSMSGRVSLWVLVILCAVLQHTAGSAAQVRQNVAQLIIDSQSIVSGVVAGVRDGVDEYGTPYTLVTIAVIECPKGGIAAGATLAFRQFGFSAPRRRRGGDPMPESTPEGFPRWTQGERVVAFMGEAAPRTGFRTTTGLAQGKFLLADGQLRNEFDNVGLFVGLQVRPGLLTDDERTMIGTQGAVDAATFLGLVRRAVREQWIENGMLR